MSVRDKVAAIESLRFAEQAADPSGASIAANFGSIYRKIDGFYVIDESSVVSMLVQAPDAATPQTIIQVGELTNTIIGDQVGDPSGTSCTFLGQLAGANGGAGNDNTFIGWEAGTAYTTGAGNLGAGVDALYALADGDANVALGNGALYDLVSGDQNIAFGKDAGANVLGSGNIFLGYQAGFSETGSNTLYIDNSNTASPLIYGEFDNNFITINGLLAAGSVAPTNSQT